MSTRFEKVEAQKMAFGCCGTRFIRHLIGPVELEHLFLTADNMWELLRENKQLKAEIERMKNEHSKPT